MEIFDNDIVDNDTANIIISSYYATGYQGTREMAADYDPYPETIYVYGNRFFRRWLITRRAGSKSTKGRDVWFERQVPGRALGRFMRTPTNWDGSGNLKTEYGDLHRQWRRGSG